MNELHEGVGGVVSNTFRLLKDWKPRSQVRVPSILERILSVFCEKGMA